MPNRNRWMVPSLTALLLATAAGLAYAAASEAEAAGVDLAEASDEAAEVRRSQIKLVLDHDGSAERLELANLHEMAVGESRSLATESGTPVVVTRDEQGFEIDLDGKKIRLMDHFSGGPEGGSWTSTDGTTQFHKRIIVHDGADAAEGGANVMILRNKVAVDENGAVITESADGDGGRVVVMRRTPAGGGDAHAFAFTTEGGELPALPLSVEATIERLQASAKFQELDEATRARVLEALRETAPKAGTFVTGEPGARTIVLEIEDEDGPDESN
jgi:hypothetical protein